MKIKPLYGILLRPLKGKFTQWKEGEKVRVHRVKGVRWLIIEKPSSVRPDLPLFSRCCNVPRRAVKIL